MHALKTVNLLKSMIPISYFNKGMANKIFADVKLNGTRIVVKNNVPECVLMSPDEYQTMMEEYENAVLYAEAQRRASDDAKALTQAEVLLKHGFSEAELSDVDVELE